MADLMLKFMAYLVLLAVLVFLLYLLYQKYVKDSTHKPMATPIKDTTKKPQGLLVVYKAIKSLEEQMETLNEKVNALSNSVQKLNSERYSINDFQRKEIVELIMQIVAKSGVRASESGSGANPLSYHTDVDLYGKPSTRKKQDEYPSYDESKPDNPYYRNKQENEGIDSLYNQSLRSQNKQNEFYETHKPVRIGVANAMERRKDPNLEPQFEDDERGEYLAVSINDQNRQYAVYPLFDVPLKDSSYGAGAMGIVFDCSEYDGRSDYDIVKVEKPATFEKKGGNKWNKQRQGILRLKKQD